MKKFKFIISIWISFSSIFTSLVIIVQYCKIRTNLDFIVQNLSNRTRLIYFSDCNSRNTTIYIFTIRYYDNTNIGSYTLIKLNLDILLIKFFKLIKNLHKSNSLIHIQINGYTIILIILIISTTIIYFRSNGNFKHKLPNSKRKRSLLILCIRIIHSISISYRSKRFTIKSIIISKCHSSFSSKFSYKITLQFSSH